MQADLITEAETETFRALVVKALCIPWIMSEYVCKR